MPVRLRHVQIRHEFAVMQSGQYSQGLHCHGGSQGRLKIGMLLLRLYGVYMTHHAQSVADFLRALATVGEATV